MSEPRTADPAQPADPSHYPGGKRAAAFTAAGVLVLAACAPWTEFGTQVLLSLVPGLSVKAASGTLVGRFAADRLSLDLGDGERLVVDRPAWSPWRLERVDGGWSIHLQRLSAARVALQGTPTRSAPSTWPSDLRLPLGLEADEVRIDQLELGLPTPVREIQARLALVPGAGAQHHLDLLDLHWERLRGRGALRVTADAPMTVEADLDVTGNPTPDPGDALPAGWRARLQARGPARQLAVEARVDAADQHLDAAALVEPAAAWPLRRVEAWVAGFDLGALGSGLPNTALTGHVRLQPVSPVGTTRRDEHPGRLEIDLRNQRPATWRTGGVPVAALQLSAHADLSDPERGRLERLFVQAADARGEAGSLQGDGQWQLDGQGAARALRWTLQTEWRDLQPDRLDPAAPSWRLRGPVTGSGVWPWPGDDRGAGVTAAPPPASAAGRSARSATPARPAPAPAPELQWRLRAELAGRFPDERWPDARLDLVAQGGRRSGVLERFEARAGAAQLHLSGRLQAPTAGATAGRPGPWRLEADGRWQDVDPTVWWPGLTRTDQSPWRRGPHRLAGQLKADLQAGASVDTDPPQTMAALLRRLRGEAEVTLAPSRLGGLPVAGQLRLQRSSGAADSTPVAVLAELTAGARSGTAPDNRLRLEGQLDPQEAGSQDRWSLFWHTPALAGVSQLLALVQRSETPDLDGDSEGQLLWQGRWPEARGEGRLQARHLSLRLPGEPLPWHADGVSLQGQLAPGTRGELDLGGQVERLRPGNDETARLEHLILSLRGQADAHHLSAQADVLTGANRPRSLPERARLVLAGDGALAAPARDGSLEWTGQLQQLQLLAPPVAYAQPAATAPTSAASAAAAASASLAAPPARAWLQLDPTRLVWRRGPGGTLAQAEATRLRLNDAVLAVEALRWQQPPSGPPALRIAARLEPLAIAPWLQRAQPGFGWNGDLRVRGQMDVTDGPEGVRLDARLEQAGGDLQVDEPELTGGPQRLGLRALALTLSARDGHWHASQQLRGDALGQLNGEQTLETGSASAWPSSRSSLRGQVSIQIEQLGRIGNWGRWLPPGWRVGGQAQAQARLAGTVGAPRLSGELEGRQITVRNALEGVDWSDAQLRLLLEGDTARIEQLSLRAGEGRLSATGQARFDTQPRADLQWRAERFAALQRVDRRVVVSGQAALGLDARNLTLKGQLRADEGRIDFSRSDAPSLSDDVEVLQAATPEAAAPAGPGREPRRQELDLRLDLGPAFLIRGRGLNTRLEGELRLTSPANRLAVNGTIRAVDGTYAAYGQKLGIDRGELAFRGAADNPRLDVLATRQDLDDVRVGVAISGTTQNPRVRLYADPEMSDNDKLSWLLLGRASDGLARTDLALLQRAAYALVAGESDSPSLMQRLGVDSLSVRQETDGDVRATVVSLGKQISRRWYLGYERSLNATTGTWQLVYRIAQRFTLRAQSGAENALDVIWSWKWGEPAQAPATGASR